MKVAGPRAGKWNGYSLSRVRAVIYPIEGTAFRRMYPIGQVGRVIGQVAEHV